MCFLLVGVACDADLPWLGRGNDAVASERPTSALLAPGEEGEVHTVRLVARGDAYAFEPSLVRVRAGDVIRFVQTSFQPEAVTFDSAAIPPSSVAALRASGLFAAPLLTAPGAAWEVRIPDLPPGEYPFVSVPHASYGMRGSALIEPVAP